MRDMTLNLPTWAWQLGYELEGDMGSFGDLYLSKYRKVTKKFNYWEVPNIFEIGEIISGIEGSYQWGLTE